MGLDKSCSHGLRLKKVGQNIVHASSKQPVQQGLIIRALDLSGQFAQGGGRLEEIGINKASSAFPKRQPFWVVRGVAAGKTGDFRLRRCHIVPDQQARTIGKGLKTRRVQVKDLKSMAAQFEVLDNLVLQQVAYIRTGGESIPGEQFFGQTRTTYHSAAFKQ